MKLGTGLRSYLQLLGGSLGRVLLQAIYFGTLVNCLSLADYGSFATSLAAALIIANGGSYGFAAPLFRTATMRRKLLGWYVSGFYAYALAGLPMTFGVAVLLHAVAFEKFIALPAFLSIVASEALCWRLIDAVSSMNYGLGRFATGAMAGMVGMACRAVAVLAFALFGTRDLDHWCYVYLAANVVAAAIAVLALHPRVRLRWSWPLFLARLPESYSYAALNLVQSLQSEADKLLVLFLTDQRTAGIYALSMRLLELSAVPIRSFYSIYVQRLMRQRAVLRDWSVNLRVELGIAATSFGLFAGFVFVLSLRPGLLGHNIESAFPFFSLLLAVAPAKLLVDYHREVFFAANRVSVFALMSLAFMAIKTPVLALLALHLPLTDWPLPLSVLAVALYLLSAGVTFAVIFSGARKPLAGDEAVAAAE